MLIQEAWPATAGPTLDAPVARTPSDPAVKILCVDDQPANLLALDATLRSPGQDVVTARTGEEALRRLLDEDFAVVLLDVRMPGMSGFEVAQLIRGRQRSRHTPIIFLTAYDSEDVQMLHGYSLGAVDYLRKPIVPAVLRSKVGVFVDIFRKTEQVKCQAERLRQLEQREHERQLAEERAAWEAKRLQEELRIARQIQQKLFPVAPLPVPGFDVSGASFPAEATGGDYFDYVPLPGDCLGVVIGDVTGHGFGPALLMAQARAYLRAFLLMRTDLADVLDLLNRALAADTPEDRFATMVLARLDPSGRRLDYVSAGHVTGYVLDASGEIKAALPSTAPPLAILPDAEFMTGQAVPLDAGDVVLLLTDGFVEAHTASGPLFGAGRVLQTVREHRDRSAREMVHALYGAVRTFCADEAPFDDMTAVIIKAEQLTL